MSSPERLTVIGGTPSPYSRKMLSLLRYRRIPYNIIWAEPRAWLDAAGLEKPKLVLYPVFLLPDANGKPVPTCDSTPIIRDLESRYGGRTVISDNPVIAFLDYFLEDFADEWFTRCMFHYRWFFEEDIENAGTHLPLTHMVNMPEDIHWQTKDFFTRRQIDRQILVGASADTATVIQDSYSTILKILNRHFSRQTFLLGSRPGASDFAFYGQLTQLIGIDPTPRAIAHKIAPRVVAWTAVMEDQSGLDPSEETWNDPDALPESLHELLCEAGRTYVPVQLANEAAVKCGDSEWRAPIEGVPWSQPAVSYQAKCLGWVRDEFAKLDDLSRQKVLDILAGTGCEVLFEGA